MLTETIQKKNLIILNLKKTIDRFASIFIIFTKCKKIINKLIMQDQLKSVFKVLVGNCFDAPFYITVLVVAAGFGVIELLFDVGLDVKT